MCRLIILSSDKNQTPAQNFIFNQMVLLSGRMNNRHGTGLIVKNGKALTFLKSGQPAEDFVLSPAWAQLVDKPHKTAFGHTRLASSGWRLAWNEAYPEAQAHPQRVNEQTLLIHNGMFNEHERLAKKLKIEGSTKEVTDTMAFARLLGEVTEKAGPTEEEIITALEEAGKCEYTFVVVSTANRHAYIVRGEKDLYVAKTNYGLMLNTARVNIEDTIKESKLALISMADGPIQLEETIKSLDEWSIWALADGQLERVCDIPERVRKVNDPPIVVRTTASPAHSPAQTSFLSGLGGASPEDTVDWDHVEGAAQQFLQLKQMVPELVTDAELSHMLCMSAPGDATFWWEFTPLSIENLKSLLAWAFEEHKSVCGPTEKKDGVWLEFLIKNGFDLDDLSLDPYKVAVLLVPELVIPYFLNTEEELERLVA